MLRPIKAHHPGRGIAALVAEFQRPETCGTQRALAGALCRSGADKREQPLAFPLRANAVAAAVVFERLGRLHHQGSVAAHVVVERDPMRRLGQGGKGQAAERGKQQSSRKKPH